MNIIESVVGLNLHDTAEEGMKEAPEEEIKLIMESKGGNYGEGGIKKEKNGREQVQLTISFNRGWQKRSSGTHNDSLSGHAFMIVAKY